MTDSHVFDADTLIDRAIQSTGLSDFGQPAFHEALTVLQRSCAKEAGLSPHGVQETHRIRIATLVNRLLMTDFVKRHPEVRGISIVRPIVIIGLPRSGTTLLHHLVGLDRSMWAPNGWELTFPVTPPNEDAETLARKTQAGIEQTYARAPVLRSMHPMAADQPDECHRLLRHTFAHQVYEISHPVPTYAEWLDQADRNGDYAYHRLQLQLLRWRRPGERTLLKCPFHIWSLEALVREYPDALLVHLHRDPRDSLGSLCGLASAFQSIRCKAVRDREIGAHWRRRVRQALNQTLELRPRLKPGLVYDVNYDELVADPLTVVDGIYRAIGSELPSDARASMTAWLERSRKSPRNYPRGLERFGLDPRAIRDELAAYYDTFRIRRGD